jgi:N-acetylmuramoyl-L-alanine amidase
MGKEKQLRQYLARQAVSDNLATIAGAPKKHSPIRYLPVRPVRTFGFLTGFAVALLTVAYLGRPWLVEAGVGLLGPTIPEIQPGARPMPGYASETDGLVLKAAPEALDQEVLPLGVERIVIDPGHGGRHSGTIAPGGIMEKDLTLDIGRRLRDLLELAAFEVVMTRDEDETIPLDERTNLANEKQGDIFVSIHVNWIEAREIRGVETFFLGPTEDPYLKELAAAENQESGYSLADYRHLLEGIFTERRNDQSLELAESIQGGLLRSLRRTTPSLADRGVKTAPFVVLVGTEMPAILAEVACLSNAEEAILLGQSSYRQEIAQALFLGIRMFADSLQDSQQKGNEA